MSKEKLYDMFDAVVKQDEETIKESYSMYIESLAKSIFKDLLEETKKPIRLKGDDVLVNGKKVGSISHDADKEDGIEYTCDSGKKSKHESVAKLFDHLSKEYKLEDVKESLAEEGKKDLSSKTEKDFKKFKNDDDLKLSKVDCDVDDKAGKDDASADHAAGEKGKRESRAKVDKAAKRKIDWRV